MSRARLPWAFQSAADGRPIISGVLHVPGVHLQNFACGFTAGGELLRSLVCHQKVLPPVSDFVTGARGRGQQSSGGKRRGLGRLGGFGQVWQSRENLPGQGSGIPAEQTAFGFSTRRAL